jgi:hypothetical protein
MRPCSGDMFECLLSGGDERLALDEVSGLNKYGHGVWPLPRALAFGSSTASTISPGAFEVAGALHRQLTENLKTQPASRLYERGMTAIRDRLCATLGLTDTDVIMAASGTGIHLLLSQLLVGPSDKPLLALVPRSSETGSGVALALSGCHFVASGCDGQAFTKGAELGFGATAETLEFALRDAQGGLRLAAEIEAQLDAAIGHAARAGRHSLLVVADVSKTGLIAPDLATVLRLKQRWPEALTILIDACQFRLDPETIRAYLNRELLVAITGSKFIGGPSFSGALLCPPQLSRVLRERPLPETLGSYSVQADWPAGWRARRDLADKANWGLLLRWNAALLELTDLLAIPSAERAKAAQTFCDIVQDRLKNDAAFVRVPGRTLNRSALLPETAGFDAIQTIFPFILQTPLRVLTAEETAAVHQHLAAGHSGKPVHLGQPVGIGADRAALRLCLSAPLLVKAAQGRAGMRAILAQAMEALDRTSQAAQRLTGTGPRAHFIGGEIRVAAGTGITVSRRTA